MELNGLDIALLAVVGLSAIFGAFRGFIREILSLLAWLIAGWLAMHFFPVFADRLTAVIEQQTLRQAAAFLLIFLAALLAIALVNRLLALLIRVSQLGGIDRLLGFIFGALRGVMIGVVFVVMIDLSPLADSSAWAGSVVVDGYRQLAQWSSKHLGGRLDSARDLLSRFGPAG